MEGTQTQGWHTAQWGTWGWVETILKLIAIAAGMIAFFQTSGDLVFGGNPHLAAVVVAALIALASVGQVLIRFTQRETVSFIFAILNLLGHLGVFVALARVPESMALPLIFGVFYVLGQLAKLVFLRVSGYTEGGADSRSMLMVTGGLTLIYAVFTVLLLV